MSGDAEVLKQFLVSLGFQIDQSGMRRFTDSLTRTTGAAGVAGKTILGIGAAAQAMVIAFSSSMEKLYYQSKRTGASVENLQALEFGSKKIGLAAGQAREMLEGMASNLRMNPGLLAMLKNFGINAEGRDGAEVMIDLVKRLSEMPHYVGAQFASMFGMDEKTFLMLKQGLPELIKGTQELKNINSLYGVDADKAAQASVEMMNSYRDISERTAAIGRKWSVELMPHFREFNSLIIGALDRMANVKLSEGLDKVIDFAKTMGRAREGVAKILDGDVKAGVNMVLQNSPGGAAVNAGIAAIGDGRRAAINHAGRSHGGQINYNAPASGDLFGKLEQQYGLPSGLLDKIWAKESARGKYMKSPAGAQGHFQFMPGTAREWGVDDPNNLEQSATGAAKYMQWLSKRYSGNLQSALAAYNYGPGNFDKAGGLGGRLPRETRDYVEGISGRPIQLTTETNIHIGGVSNPSAAADLVVGAQGRVAGDMVRNLQGAIQ